MATATFGAGATLAPTAHRGRPGPRRQRIGPSGAHQPGHQLRRRGIHAAGTLDPFRGATIAWNGSGWDLTRTDGMIYVFSGNQPPQAIRDRHGNQITIQHATGGYR
jgi:hypothetical protein